MHANIMNNRLIFYYNVSYERRQSLPQFDASPNFSLLNELHKRRSMTAKRLSLHQHNSANLRYFRTKSPQNFAQLTLRFPSDLIKMDNRPKLTETSSHYLLYS